MKYEDENILSDRVYLKYLYKHIKGDYVRIPFNHLLLKFKVIFITGYMRGYNKGYIKGKGDSK